MKRFMLGLVAATFLCGTCGVLAADDNWGVVSEQEWATGAPADYPEANAVVLFDRARQTVEIPYREYYPHTIFERHLRIKVLNRAGADEVGNGGFTIYTTDMLEMVEAHTILPDGSVYEVGDKDYFDKTIGDWRYRSFAYPKIDSGCIVELRYRTNRDRALWINPWYFHHQIYTLESTYILSVGGGLKYDYIARNIPVEQQRPAVRDLEGLGKVHAKEFTWRLTKLLPIKAEPYMTCVEDYMSSVTVLFTGIRTSAYSYDAKFDWKDLGMRFEAAIEGYLSKPRQFKKMVHDITKGFDTRYEKSKAIYDYVCTKIETRQQGYYAVTDHDNLAKMVREGYGTAWEKNLLLLEMLKAARIKAWPILICTRDQAKFDPRWFDLKQFSHLIIFTEVEQGGIYLDATSKYCAYGTLPPLCRVDGGLLVDRDHSELVRVVTNDPTSMRVDMHKIRLTADGSAACSTVSLFSGYLAAEYGRRYETHSPDKFIAGDLLSQPLSAYHPGGHNCDLDSLNRLKVAADYTLDGCGRWLDNNLVVQPLTCMFENNPFSSRDRFFPVDFNYKFTYQDIVQLEAPEGATVAELPSDTTIVSDGVTFVRQSIGNGTVATIETKLEIDKPFYQVGEYGRLRNFFDQVAALEADRVVFSKTEE